MTKKEKARKTLQFCKSDCIVRINSVALAFVPAIEAATSIYPTLQDHLPADVYSIGFVLLAIVNILRRIKLQRDEDKTP
jgi:hypothetical protein